MSSESYKIGCYVLLALLAYSVFSHYNTGSNYTETCFRIFAVVNDDEARFEQVLGKRLSSECNYRMSSD
jgi:hypothetical protein